MVAVKSKMIMYIFSLLIFFYLTACNFSADAATPGAYSVDSTFTDFYKELGGVSVLGPAISPAFVDEGITYQYIVSGLMAYQPNGTTLSRFHFSPLASMEWGINDVIDPAPSDLGINYVNGHSIWEEVLPLYHRYGSEIIGLPVTGVKANDDKQRYEQYFEGLGFYRSYSDSPGQIRLMPYGSWMCGENCQYQDSDLNPPSSSYIRDFSETEQLFLEESERLGYGFSGAPLASPKVAQDGNFEMVFENVAMYIDPQNGSQIKLRPLPTWLGIQPDPGAQAAETDWSTFYPLNDGLGYNVPNDFHAFIENHGGVGYSGYPITEYRLLQDGGYSQCFTNLCLEFHPTAPEQLQIRPHALGIDYQTNGDTSSIAGSSTADALQVNVSEEYPLVSSGQRQVINIQVSQRNTPVSNVVFSLSVKQPDGITKTYQLTPTGEGGTTRIELDPISGPNGSIIQYEVCIVEAVTPQICFTRDYTIWNQ